MKLTELIKQLKREFKSGGEVEVTAISITPEGKVIIGGSFESGPVRASVFDGTLESKRLEKSVAVFDERVDDGPILTLTGPGEIRSVKKLSKRE